MTSWTVLHIFKDVARWHYFFSSRGICIDIIWTQWCTERCLRQNGNDIAISSWWCWRQMGLFFCSFKKYIYKNVPKLLQSKQACVINYSSRFQNQQEGRNSSSMHTRGEPSCNPPVPRKQQNIFIHWEYIQKNPKQQTKAQIHFKYMLQRHLHATAFEVMATVHTYTAKCTRIHKGT